MTDAIDLPPDRLYRHLADGGLVQRLLELARDEDLGQGAAAGDITSEVCIGPEEMAQADLIAREAGTVAGLIVLPEVIRTFNARVTISPLVHDGQEVAAKTVLATLRGPKREILTIERVALNLIGRLSGIASTTAKFVRAAAGDSGRPARARIFDTRKTTPGLRVLEKYAVRCGGGCCHRVGLYDAVLIKDNHLAGVAPGALAAFVADAAARAKARNPGLLFVEVEVDSLDQFRRLLALPAGTIDIVLLDNMTTDQLREASALRDEAAPALELEASGGIRLETVRQIAETGVDRISVGALTHSALALDVALDIQDGGGGGSLHNG